MSLRAALMLATCSFFLEPEFCSQAFLAIYSCDGSIVATVQYCMEQTSHVFADCIVCFFWHFGARRKSLRAPLNNKDK